jgi:type I restriction enzyme S subunit
LRFPEFEGELENQIFDNICSITTGNRNTQDKEDNGLYPFYVRSQNIERINSYTFEGEAILTAGDGVGVGKIFHYVNEKVGVHQRVYILSDFKCSGKFVYYYFASQFHNRVKKMSAKNSVDSVRREMIAQMSISLPIIEEQQKIAAFLSLLDDRISTQSQIIEEFKTLQISLINSYYCLQWYENSILLEDCIVQKSERNKKNEDYPVLSVSNKYGFIRQSEQFENREIASEDTVNYKIVRKNDFAYNPARINVGSVARLINYNSGIVSPMYVCFHTKDNLLSDFLEFYFNSQLFKNEMIKRLEGSVRQCLTFESLCNIPICLPSLDKQKTISARLVAIQKKIDIENSIKELLIKQKKYLLQQMFI